MPQDLVAGHQAMTLLPAAVLAASLLYMRASFADHLLHQRLMPFCPHMHAAASFCCCHRFDVRALLDFYKEPDPRVLAARQKSNEELKLEQVSAAAGDDACCCMLYMTDSHQLQ
jgi:hypothetical protein